MMRGKLRTLHDVSGMSNAMCARVDGVGWGKGCILDCGGLGHTHTHTHTPCWHSVSVRAAMDSWTQNRDRPAAVPIMFASKLCG